MTLMRYEPWRLVNQLQNEINRMFDSRFFNLGRFDADESSVVTCDWIPAVDIKEEADRFVLTADIPGVDPKDIEVTMENGQLTIRGERKSESREERDGYRRVERVTGTFYRRFALPDTADADGITARGVNGVLEVVIPKQQKVQPRRIAVKS
ncbi:MAG TPA: Hsp20/alpha crystallin family protein [Gammaproteobacteria bacterium]|nr:Hsp20/alpha crystallin family protein [Gammaproteobacteria bacterium]